LNDEFGAVIPAYNEAAHISDTIRKIKKYIKPSNMIVVDDGSTDNTAELAGLEEVPIIRHKSNMGKGIALIEGLNMLFSKREIEASFTLDADGQHDPDDIPKFIELYRQRHIDLLIGNRMNRTENMPYIRILSNRISSFIISLRAGTRIEDSQSGYRLIRSSLFKELALSTSHYDTESEILIRAGIKKARIESIPTCTIYAAERSTINPIRDTFRFLILILRSLFW